MQAQVVIAAVLPLHVHFLLFVLHVAWSIIQITDISHFEAHIDHEWQLGLWVDAEDEILVDLFQYLFFDNLVPEFHLIGLELQIMCLKLVSNVPMALILEG